MPVVVRKLRERLAFHMFALSSFSPSSCSVLVCSPSLTHKHVHKAPSATLDRTLRDGAAFGVLFEIASMVINSSERGLSKA